MDIGGNGPSFSVDRGEGLEWDSEPSDEREALGLHRSELAGIRLVIPGPPLAQPRQRHRIVVNGARSYVSNYTPAKAPINSFKASVKLAAAAAYNGAPLAGPVEARIRFVFPRPKSKVFKKREMPREWHTSKSDLDNLVKAIFDSLNLLLLTDDAVVSRLYCEKVIAAGDEQPHTEVFIRLLEDRRP